MRAMTIAALALALAASSAVAQEWPSGTVRVVVPYGPGSTPDIVARVVSERLAAKLGKPFVVENKPGAAGMLGTDLVAKAAPDGQTIGISIAGPLAVNALLYRKMPYDPAELAPVTIAATQASVVVASPSLNVASAAELVQLLKANPGKYSFAAPGVGSTPHLSGEIFRLAFGLDLPTVQFTGAGPAIQSTLGGQEPGTSRPSTSPSSAATQMRSSPSISMSLHSPRPTPRSFVTLVQTQMRPAESNARSRSSVMLPGNRNPKL